MRAQLIKTWCFSRDLPQTRGHPFLRQGRDGNGVIVFNRDQIDLDGVEQRNQHKKKITTLLFNVLYPAEVKLRENQLTLLQN